MCYTALRKELILMPWLPSVVWLALLIFFAVVEAATVGLVSIWFAAGALVALLSTFFISNIWLQIGIFLIVSAVTLALVRPMARKYVSPQRIATNADRAVGKKAVVTQAIDNLSAAGEVSVLGMTWTARSTSGEAIAAGSTVTVDRIEGVKLFVSPVPQTVKE